MAPLLIGLYARVSTDEQDLTAQREALRRPRRDCRTDLRRPGSYGHQPRPSRAARGTCRVPGRRHAGRDQARPARALAARRPRHRRRAPPPPCQAERRRLVARPQRSRRAAPVQRGGHGRRIRGRLIRMRTRERMRVAKATGRLRGKQPKLNPRQDAHLVALHRAGEHSTAELGDLFGVARSTVHRAIQRDQRRRQTVSAKHWERPATLR
jgi:hypothetical protein